MRHDRPQERPVHLLLVEDNAADARFFQEVLKTVPTPTVVHVVDDGRPALAFLHKHGAYAQAPTPEIVFLDLRLPVLSGAEVLGALKREAAFAQLPVYLFVMDTYDPDLAKIKSQGFQVEGVLTKPVQAAPLTAILRAVRRYTFGAPLQEESGLAPTILERMNFPALE